MLFRARIIAALFFLGLTCAQSASFSQLAGYNYNTFVTRSMENATLQAVDFQPVNLPVGLAALSFISNDSVFLRFASVSQILCVGCSPLIDDGTFTTFPLPIEYQGLPLQKLVRVNYLSTTGQYHFLVANHNQVIHFYFKKSSNHSSPALLQSQDTIAIPMSALQSIYGIDDFVADSSGNISFKIFGKAGLRAFVTVSSGRTVNLETHNFSDSLDISASSQGLYGTVRGQVLDSTLDWIPVKIGKNPISLINSAGLVGDSGLFALKVLGTWRVYSQGTENLRDFNIKLHSESSNSDVNLDGGSSNTYGNWGTSAVFWDNLYKITSSRFIKDDSTVWANTLASPPAVFSKDSIFAFEGIPDSTSLSLFDSDNNYSHPNVYANRFGASILLGSIWGRFSRGCGTADAYDTITCYPASSAPKISLSWNSNGVRIKSTLVRGAWVIRLYPNSLNAYYSFSSQLLQVDTVIPWIPGYSMRVAFQNASYTVVNDDFPIALHTPVTEEGSLSARVFGRQIQWTANLGAASVLWELVDVQGKKLLWGKGAGRAGVIQANTVPRGVYFLTLSSAKQNWRGKVVLK